MNPKLIRLVIVLTFLSLGASAAQAMLSKADRKQIKSQMKSTGILYPRMDLPCATGRHPYGTYVRPLVEVSPEKINTDVEDGIRASWWHADSTYWGVRINDALTFDEMDFEADEGTVEIELETVGEEIGTVVEFVGIYSLDDFQAAFDRAFSSRPLQEEHEDWADDIKQAIDDRRLKNGMTKRQVYYVTGRPERFETKEEDGMEVEIWNLRQNKGTKMGYFTTRVGETTGLPETIRFEDGKLVGVGKSTELELD